MILRILLIVISLGFIVALGSACSEAAEPEVVIKATATTVPLATAESDQNQTESPTVLAWIPFWDQDIGEDSFRENIDQIDIISMVWYLLRGDEENNPVPTKPYTIKPYMYATENQSIINLAHENGVKVLAVVSNNPDEDEGGDWDTDRVEQVISTAEARENHIADLVSLTQRMNFDGIDIDYEFLPERMKENFTLFIQELSVALHAEGKILGVALHPKITEGDPAYSNGSEAQDWAELCQYADNCYLMTYEEHWNAGDPGPLASVPWMEQILLYATDLIPPDKLFAGIPTDAYDWPGDRSPNGLIHDQVLSLMSDHGPKVLWDPESQTRYFNYTSEGGIDHTVWFEDAASLKAKLDLLDTLGLNNISIWRLGGEDKEMWEVLRNSR